MVSHRKLLYKQPPTLAELESCMVNRPTSRLSAWLAASYARSRYLGSNRHVLHGSVDVSLRYIYEILIWQKVISNLARGYKCGILFACNAQLRVRHCCDLVRFTSLIPAFFAHLYFRFEQGFSFVAL